MYIVLFYGIIIGIIVFVVRYYIDTVICLWKTGGVPYIPSFDRTLRTLIHELPLKEGSILIDLGCGDGKVLRKLSQAFPTIQYIGYDIARFPLLLGRIINTLYGYKHIDLRHGNFLQHHIPHCDYIYCYLLPHMLKKLQPILTQHLQRGTIIISNTFACSKQTPARVIRVPHTQQNIYIYHQ